MSSQPLSSFQACSKLLSGADCLGRTAYPAQVLFACALLPDIEQMPSRDLTHVGDRGSALSGGQRAR